MPMMLIGLILLLSQFFLAGFIPIFGNIPSNLDTFGDIPILVRVRRQMDHPQSLEALEYPDVVQ